MTRHRVCHNCKNRTYDCHSKCELYINECKEIEKEKEQIRVKKELQFQLDKRENEIRYKIKHRKSKIMGKNLKGGKNDKKQT